MLGYNLYSNADNELLDLLRFEDPLGGSDDLLSIYNMKEMEDFEPMEFVPSRSTGIDILEMVGSQNPDHSTPQLSIGSGNRSRTQQGDFTFKQTASTHESSGALEILPKRKPKVVQKSSGLVEREIFLHSKLKIRAPRRKSFDLGDLRSSQTDLCFDLFGVRSNQHDEQPHQEAPSPWCFDFCMDKENLNKVYNQVADFGKITASQLPDLQPTELKILEKMLWLRLTAVKVIPASHPQNLFEDLENLNLLLAKSICSKKRTEEQLKKHFKTVLKIMHDEFKEKYQDSSKKVFSESKSKDAFIDFYFGAEKAKFSKLFKCVQMSREFYSKIFSNSLFQSQFAKCAEGFMEQFLAERNAKTTNLINSISHELLSNTESEASLRTPWTVAEATAADQQMKKLLLA